MICSELMSNKFDFNKVTFKTCSSNCLEYLATTDQKTFEVKALSEEFRLFGWHHQLNSSKIKLTEASSHKKQQLKGINDTSRVFHLIGSFYILPLSPPVAGTTRRPTADPLRDLQKSVTYSSPWPTSPRDLQQSPWPTASTHGDLQKSVTYSRPWPTSSRDL